MPVFEVVVTGYATVLVDAEDATEAMSVAMSEADDYYPDQAEIEDSNLTPEQVVKRRREGLPWIGDDDADPT